jgi:hypothetical protein
MFGEPVISINIKPGGATKIEVENAPDSSCLLLTKTLEEAMGKVTKRELKAEGLKDATVGAGTVKVGQ